MDDTRLCPPDGILTASQRDLPGWFLDYTEGNVLSYFFSRAFIVPYALSPRHPKPFNPLAEGP